jgi:hypothetical protein
LRIQETGSNETNGVVAMREHLGNEIPDTAPYREWLAIIGSLVVAFLVCAFLFSEAFLT